MADVPKDLLAEIQTQEKMITVETAKLKEITDRYVGELEKGLRVQGGSIVSLDGRERERDLPASIPLTHREKPMNPTWVMSFPDGYETGSFLALDMGGTNLRVCEITLTDRKSEFDIIQSKYRMPEELKTGDSDELWEYIADCLQQFVETHHGDLPAATEKLPLGFTFSNPATQND